MDMVLCSPFLLKCLRKIKKLMVIKILFKTFWTLLTESKKILTFPLLQKEKLKEKELLIMKNLVQELTVISTNANLNLLILALKSSL